MIDISNEYTRTQLQSLFDLLKDSQCGRLKIPGILEKLDNSADTNKFRSCKDTKPVFDDTTELTRQSSLSMNEPIALPWYNQDNRSFSKIGRTTTRQKYKELFGDFPDYSCHVGLHIMYSLVYLGLFQAF